MRSVLVPSRQRRLFDAGFSLVELAVVLFVVALLLGGLVTPLAAQREMQQRQQARAQLAEVVEALQGFAVINGRAPCPATTPGTVEAITAAHCAAVAGYMPGPTLGLLPLDPWGRPLRMATASAFVSMIDGATMPDAATTPGALLRIFPSVHVSDVRACAVAPGAYAVSIGPCPAGWPSIADGLAVAVWSDGPDAAGAADDLVIWPAVPVLASRMIAAGRWQ